MLIPLGRKALPLAVPEGVTLQQQRPLATEPPAARDAEVLAAAFAAPLAGLELRALAVGRRRVCLLVGDESWPAPYEIALPPLVRELTASGIRPTRIGLLTCPSPASPALGRDAIRRYGEEIVGEHEIQPYRAAQGGGLDPRFEASDLRIAVLPALVDSAGMLPPGAEPHAVLAITPAPVSGQRLLTARFGAPAEVFKALRAGPVACPGHAVYLTSGGGEPCDATLEDALAGLRRLPAGSPDATLVLCFEGGEGLGSSRFTLDLFDLLRLIGEGAPAQAPASSKNWDPAGGLYELLCASRRLVLWSPGLADHEDGDALVEVLAECPRLAERFVFAGDAGQLWAQLQAWHGGTYRLFAEPLGWRAGAI